MSLALVSVSRSDFNFIYSHLLTRDPRYRNMHLREACQRNNLRDLRYLHAMHANASALPEIEGMISGPGVFWHYKLLAVGSATQLNVLSERGSSKALARMQRTFLSEVFARVQLEQSGVVHHPVRTPGQFYLRRSIPGMPATHPTCRLAVTAGALDNEFASRLAVWQLEVLHP
jgi:hypothetical protein